jgi:lipase
MGVCQEHYISIGGVNFCWFEWGKKREGEETILLVHATGFHARCWDQTIAGLGDRHIIALDQRGHGRTDAIPFEKWDQFGTDLIEFIRQLGLTNLVGVGHSMGGFSVAMAAAELEGCFKRLILLDPVILDPAQYVSDIDHIADIRDDKGRHPVAKRRNNFSSADEMFDALKPKGGYTYWQDAVMRDYCEHGLLPAKDGEGFVLACPPEFEASVYTGSAGTDIYDFVARVQVPVFIVRAKMRDPNQGTMDFSMSPTWEHLAEKFPDGHDNYRPDLTHYIPMQDPGFAARYILSQEN